MTSEIPVWVNGVEKWVTGVSRRTTCGDLVRALLATQRSPADDAEPDDVEVRHHAIVERWRQVERPLDPSARIQKVWRSWGDDRSEVRLSLKRTNPLTPKELKQLRRKHHSRTRWRSSSSLETVHPRKLGPSLRGAGQEEKSDVVERLMQTILVQGETIAAQLRRLQEREDLIGYYEHKMHRMREDELGSDYLLKAYLRDGDVAGSHADKTSHDSGMGAELADVSADGDVTASGDIISRDVSEEEAVTDLKKRLDYLERIVELNRRIASEEEESLRLSHCIRRAAAATDHSAGAGGGAGGAGGGGSEAELARISDELAALAARCHRQTEEIARNERAIADCDRRLAERRHRLTQLEREMDAVDVETGRLLAEGLQVSATLTAPPPAPWPQAEVVGPQPLGLPLLGPPPAEPRWTVATHSPVSAGGTPAAHKEASGVADGDSNSDTGLSSLHSSSDEAAVGYVLDTLV